MHDAIKISGMNLVLMNGAPKMRMMRLIPSKQKDNIAANTIIVRHQAGTISVLSDNLMDENSIIVACMVIMKTTKNNNNFSEMEMFKGHIWRKQK